MYFNLFDHTSNIYQEISKNSERVMLSASNGNPRKISHRLSQEQVDGLVAEYRSRMPTPELCRRYSLGKSTVLGLLKAAGVTMRKQGLPDSRVAEAVTRYEQGWTAPQIADHYGVSGQQHPRPAQGSWGDTAR
jgi:hypothetical protein